MELFRALKLKPTSQQACELLRPASYCPDPDIFLHLLANVRPEDLNQGEPRSCRALEEMTGYEFIRGLSLPTPDRNARRLRCISMLLQAGARWNPCPESTRHIRRSFLSHEPHYVTRVIRLLLEFQNSIDVEKIWVIFRTDKMKEILQKGDSTVWNLIDQSRQTMRGAP